MLFYAAKHIHGIPLPLLSKKTENTLMSQIQEDKDLKDVEDKEYNKILDDATKAIRTSKDKIVEAAKRLESL